MANRLTSYGATLSQEPPYIEQHQTLKQALEAMDGDSPDSIPLIVRLLENPASPIALPGKIDLYGHDCLHLLLGLGITLEDEAFVVGFTMGNDLKITWFHLALFKLCSCTLYPKTYRFNRAHLKVFDLGVAYGRSLRCKNLNQIDFRNYEQWSLPALRELFGIEPG